MVLWGALLVLVAIAAVTDVLWHRIFNWNTYPGMLLGLSLRGALEGWSATQEGLRGLVVCGGILLLCAAMFPIGGGDAKLIAMMGSFLGMDLGLEAVLWTFILAGVLAVAWLIWQFGVSGIARACGRQVSRIWRARGWTPLTDAERKPLEQPLFLAPAGLLACLVVTWPDWQHWFAQR